MTQQQQPLNLILPGELAMALIRYLETRPLAEAVGMWGALRQLQPVEAPAPEPVGVPGSAREAVPQPVVAG